MSFIVNPHRFSTGGGGGSTPTIVGVTTASGGFNSSNPLTVAWPGGHVSGDEAWLCITRTSNATFTAPASPWVLETTISGGGGGADAAMEVYRNTATSGAMPSVVVPFDTASLEATMTVVNGASSFNVLAETTQGSATTAISISGGTTTAANALLIFMLAEKNATDTQASFTFIDTNMTSVTYQAGVNFNRFGTGGGAHAGSGEKASTGTVGAVTGTLPASVTQAAILIECLP